MFRTFAALLCCMLLQPAYSQEFQSVLQTSSGELYGSLIIPQKAKSPIPVVLIIAGSGPTDRNGNQQEYENNSLKMLAEGLAKSGIASLRYDKRGVGASIRAIKREQDATIETYAEDARGWIDLLAANSNFSQVIIAGHSEGALVAILAALDNPKVKKLISLAGAGSGIDIILKEQLQRQIPAGYSLYNKSAEIIDSLKAGKKVDDVPGELYPLFRPSVQAFVISEFRHDPAEDIKRLNIPVMIVQGRSDLQVTTKDSEQLLKSYPSATLMDIDWMTHLLKECHDPESQNNCIGVDVPLHKDLVPALVRFIRHR